MTEAASTCPYHYGVNISIENLGKKVDAICEGNKDQWDQINKHKKDTTKDLLAIQKEKVPMKLFYALVTVLCLIFAGVFGINLSVQSKMNDMQTVQAVILEKVK